MQESIRTVMSLDDSCDQKLWGRTFSLVKTELEQLRGLVSTLYTFLVEKVAPV